MSALSDLYEAVKADMATAYTELYVIASAQRTGGVTTLTLGAHDLTVGETISLEYLGADFTSGNHVLTAVTGTTVSYADAGPNAGPDAGIGSLTVPEPVEVLFGSEYVSAQDIAPRIVLVPTEDAFEAGPRQRNDGSQKWGVEYGLDAHIWAAAPQADATDFGDYAAVEQLLNAFVYSLRQNAMGSLHLSSGKWMTSESGTGGAEADASLEEEGRGYILSLKVKGVFRQPSTTVQAVPYMEADVELGPDFVDTPGARVQ